MNTFIELKNRYVLKGTLRGEEGLHIGTGVPGVDTDAPFIRQENRPFLPGSSLRGAMRSTVERMVRSLWGPAACCTLFSEPSAGNDCWAGNKKVREKLEQATSEGEGLRRDLAQGKGRLCPVCQLFGSTVMAARLKVTDARLKHDQEPVRRDGVGIDRDTETAADQIKYDFEVLDRGCEFEFSLHLENADDNDLALLYILLKELEHGMDVGGKKSRGLGRVMLTAYNVEYFDARWGLAKFLTEGLAKEEKGAFEKRLRGKFDALVKAGGPNGG
jgi:CRISPR-associated RAMP protein (TIGR02581 family)